MGDTDTEGVSESFETRVAHALATVLPKGAVAARSAERRYPGLQLTPLPGGLGGRSFLASAGGRTWAVRVSSAGSNGTLDIGAEAAIAAQAAHLGIAPSVVAADPDAGFLISEYRAGALPLTPEDVRRPENIPRIADLLRRLHKIRLAVRGFDPEGFALEYLQALGGPRALSDEQRGLAAEFAALGREYRLRYPRMLLCHNDLVASNILDDDGRLWLIDFEYAVMAAPVLDLAGVAGMNDYGTYERWQLAEAYYQRAAVPFTAIEFDKVIRLVRLMAYFWALSRSRHEADPTPFSQVVDHVAEVLK